MELPNDVRTTHALNAKQCQGEGPSVGCQYPTDHDRLQRSAANQELPSLTDA